MGFYVIFTLVDDQERVKNQMKAVNDERTKETTAKDRYLSVDLTDTFAEKLKMD